MQSLCCQNTSLSVVHGYWPTSIVTTMFENNQPSVAVLLPCFNEEVTIGKVVRDFKAALPGAAVYVYDNNSTDRTAEIAAAEGAIVRKEPRQGKSNVIRAMFEDIDAACQELRESGEEQLYAVTCFSDKEKFLSNTVRK